jgi:predicted secreted protein
MIAAKVGDVFRVELKSTPTTGYQWQPADLPDGVELVGSDFVPGGTAPGQGGTQRFQLRASRPGRYQVAFELKRAWETDPAGTHTFEVDAG